jgi:hypothetical protein
MRRSTDRPPDPKAHHRLRNRGNSSHRPHGGFAGEPTEATRKGAGVRSRCRTAGGTPTEKPHARGCIARAP